MMEKFRFRKKDNVAHDGDVTQLEQHPQEYQEQQQQQQQYQHQHPPPYRQKQHPPPYQQKQAPPPYQQQKYHQGHLQQPQYQHHHHHHQYSHDQRKISQHTNWNGVLQDLFGMDSPQTAESTHESTSSGVASDVTSVYPATPTMTTFKGGDSAGSASSAKSTGSQDSGTKSASISGSPRPDHVPHKPQLRGTRMSPAPPLPAVPKEAPPLPAKNTPRLTTPSPRTEYHRMNAYSESPTMVSRGKKPSRERRPRLPEPNSVQSSNNINNNNRALAHMENTDIMIPSNTSDPRAVDPSFYNEINQCYVEAMREEHFIEPFGDNRFIESHIQETYVQNDRLHIIPSPMSPVPPGGYYHNRNFPYSHHDHRLQPDMSPRDSRSRHKHHQLQQQQQQLLLLQQQQHQHQQQQHKQQQHQQQQPPTAHPHMNRQSPSVNDNTFPVTSDPQNHNHHYIHNHSLSPPPQSNRMTDRTSPNPLPNNLNKPPTPTSHNFANKLPHQNNRYYFSEQQLDTVTPRSHTPRGSHTLLTQAQVHANHQQEGKGSRNDSRIKSAHAQSESQLNHVTNRPKSARGGNPLVNGVNNLSLSQADVNTGKATVISSKGKRHLSRSSPFESLPNDVLLKIFSHLPTDHLCKCAQVCRHWYNAVWDHPILWTSIVINNQNIDIDRALKYLTRRLSYNTPKVCMILEKIKINSCCRLTDRGLQTVVKRCPELRYLDMQGCHLVTNVGVTEAVSRCVNLERLDVTGCPRVTCITLMDSVISQSASRHLQRIYLRYLDMTDCPHVTDEDLSTITSQCTQLLFFYLRRCPLITDLGVTYIANNCNSLRELSVSDCKNITDLGMRELAKLRDNLRYLSVAKCEKVSDQGVIHIAKNCSKLRYLNVRGCEAVSDTGLEFLARSCPRLRSLDIGKCDITDDGLYALSMYCPHLRKLGVKSCDAITDKGIVLVAYRCPSLQQLHVQDCCLSPDAYAMVRKYCKRAIIEHTNPGVL